MDTEFDPTAYADVVPVPDDDGQTRRHRSPTRPSVRAALVARTMPAEVTKGNHALSLSHSHSPRVQLLPAVSAVMGVFRALYAAHEASPRALILCSQAISMNAANYTAW